MSASYCKALFGGLYIGFTGTYGAFLLPAASNWQIITSRLVKSDHYKSVSQVRSLQVGPVEVSVFNSCTELIGRLCCLRKDGQIGYRDGHRHYENNLLVMRCDSYTILIRKI